MKKTRSIALLALSLAARTAASQRVTVEQLSAFQASALAEAMR